MELPTAIGFVLLGGGTLASTWCKGRARATGALQWLSVVIGLSVLSATVLLWQVLLAQEKAQVRWAMLVQAASIQNEIATQLQSCIQLLVNTAERWENQGLPSAAAWTFDARLFFRLYHDSRALVWVDPAFRIREVMVVEGQDPLPVHDLMATELWRETLTRARELRRIIVTPPFRLGTGERGFLVAVPLFQDERFDGLIIAVFDVAHVFDTILENVALNHAIAIFAGNEEIYGRYNPKDQHARAWSREMMVRVAGVTWNVRIWPKVEPLAEHFSLLPEVVLAAGTLLAILLMLAINFGQTARFHATQFQSANQGLRDEIAVRARAEVALQTSQQFLQSTLDALSAHIAILDETGTILAVNAAWHRFADANGLADPAHGVGSNYLERCAAATGSDTADAATVGEGIRAVLTRQCETFSHEYACHSPSQQQWFLLCVTRFETPDGVRAVVAHENITESKQTAETLQQQREALYQSEKLAAMSSLVAGVAHELNNPLAAIMMQADLLREDTPDGPLAERATEINASAERCVRIVRNFLAFVRQTAPERVRVNLNEVIRDAMELLAYTLHVDNIEVSENLAADLPLLWADAQQLHQVVVNLVSNAQHALREVPGPRRVTLTTWFDAAHQQVVCEVADTGPGIPPPIQERIFEPFFTTKPPGVGTGLGLPLCQGIIASHDGILSVDSQAGAGAVFRVVLPAGAVAVPESHVPEADATLTVASKKLLIVDDEAATAKALVTLLRRDGHTVDTAANGRQALEKLRLHSYDLILCDLRMPDLDGPGLYHVLEHEQPQVCQRFIFLTGDVLSPDARAFLDARSAPYLAKPLRAAELRRAVRHTLQREP
jgi:two-component system NtrC family sensor kinase